MEDLKLAAALLRWAVQNLIHNLTFIPEERMTWKPEPTAKSALEIAAEVIAGQQMMLPVLQGGEWSQKPFPQVTTLEEAKPLLLETMEQFATALEGAGGPALERSVTIGGMSIPARRAVLFPVVDAIHHHGQIAYIQMLLGDTEGHFDPEAGARFFNS